MAEELIFDLFEFEDEQEDGPLEEIQDAEIEEILHEIEVEAVRLRNRIRTKADVIQYILQVPQEFDDERRKLPDRLRKTSVPVAATKVTPLQLNAQNFVEEFLSTSKYIVSIMIALSKGDKMPVDAAQARECSRCARRWVSYYHYLAESTPPSHIRCSSCLKKIPVGRDIREIPKRRAQPDFVDMKGSPLELGPNQLKTGPNLTYATIPIADVRQQCTAEDCPLKKRTPHSVGLYSYPESHPSGVAAIVRARQSTPINYTTRVGNTRSSIGTEDFWAGNDRIPSQLREYAAVIMREERIWRGVDPKASIKDFRKEHSREAVDKMRAEIVAFRAYHCFYRPLLSDSGLTGNQVDIIPAHLRCEPGGSKAWLDRFLGGLEKVAVNDLAEDDRECALCKGVYEADVSSNGKTTESAVVLPCGHKFGEECLRMALLRKAEGGWEQNRCPFCRKEHYLPTPEPEVEMPAARNPREGDPLDLGFEI